MSEHQLQSAESDNDSWIVRNIGKTLLGLALVALLIGSAVTSQYFLSFSGPTAQDQETWGQFGDYVGGTLNPIFAFFGLIALLVTIVFQSRELGATRDELAKSVAATKHQTFENMFFQLLRLHQQIVDNIKADGVAEAQDHGYGSPVIAGRAAFSRYCELLDKDLNVLGFQFDDDATNPAIDRHSIEQSWSAFFSANYPALSHYFRNLYNILRYVDDSEGVDDKGRYTRILRAQLSAYELKLLFYNGLSESNTAFHKLAVRYALFEQIRVVPFSGAKHLEIRDNHFQFYDQGAYGTWPPPEPDYSDSSFEFDDPPDPGERIDVIDED